MASPRRYGFIDAIRGIAACLVMLQHSIYASGLLSVGPDGEHHGFIPRQLELGETGVVAFFLVSGFVIPLSLEKTANLKLFWIHRALRIYPLYLSVYFVSFAIHAGGHIHSLKAFLADFAATLFFVQEYLKQENFVGGSWTLSLELAWYVAIAILFAFSLNKATKTIVGLGVLVSVAAQICCANGLHLPMGRISMLLCCILGLVCFRYSTRTETQQQFCLMCGILIVTVGLNLFVGEKLFPAPHPTASWRMASHSWMLAGIIFFVPFVSRNSSIWNHSILTYLGQISFSIYLLHALTLTLLLRIQVTGIFLILFTFFADHRSLRSHVFLRGASPYPLRTST